MAQNTKKIGEILAKFGVPSVYRYPELDVEAGPVLLRLSERPDSTGFSLYVHGPRFLALHWWKRWNPKRGDNHRIPGFCLTFSPLVALSNRWAYRVNMGDRGWTKLDHFVCRVFRATFFVGFRARGGIRERQSGPLRSVRLGLVSNPNAIPYSFA